MIESPGYATPLGNLWWIMERTEEVGAEEEARRYGEMKYIEAMEYVQGAESLPPAGSRNL